MARRKKGKGRRSKASGTPIEAAESEVVTKDEAEAKDDGEEEDDDGEDAEDSEGAEDSEEPEKAAVKKTPPSRKGGKTAGVLAVFDHPDAILHAAERARDKGFEKWDVYTPFPIHGMDDAMGLGRSPVPWITFTAGVIGFASAIIIQFGTMVYSWPLNFGGKPFAAWPSFVPITFEMTVLFAGVSTAIGSLVLGGIFKFRKRKPHPEVTSHRFAIFVEASDPKYDEVDTVSLFEGTGAIEVRAVKEGE